MVSLRPDRCRHVISSWCGYSGIAVFRGGMGGWTRGGGTVCHMGGHVDFTLCSQCQALGQALILCRQGRGWCCLVHPCHPATLWIPALRGNDGSVWLVWLVRPRSRVRHWDRLWSSAVKGEGEDGWRCLIVAPPCGYCLKVSMTVSGIMRICRIMTMRCIVSPSPLIPLPSRERGIRLVVLSCCCPALWIPAYAGMTGEG